MKNYIAKIQNGGSKWLWMCIAVRLNKLFFHIFQCFPLDKKLIIFESEGDFCDNGYALYSYMLENGYMKKYRAVWLVENVENFQERKFENTKFCYKNDDKLNFIRDYYLAVCGHYIYDHCLMLYSKRKQQRVTFLSHGVGFKASSKQTGMCEQDGRIDEMIVTSKFAGILVGNWANISIESCRVLGYSRNDFFFENSKNVQETIERVYGFCNYSKVVLWMPTFRKSRNQVLSEDYAISKTGLPLIENKEQLVKLNKFFTERKMLLILKIHQLSLDFPMIDENYSNIQVLQNEDIEKLGMQLYQFIAYTDALITDYSSISSDYLLLNKPIIFTLNDYALYNASRGIFPENAIDYMAGPHVMTIEDLYRALSDVYQEIDNYVEERHRMKRVFHKYADGNSSKRIAEYLNL